MQLIKIPELGLVRECMIDEADIYKEDYDTTYAMIKEALNCDSLKEYDMVLREGNIVGDSIGFVLSYLIKVLKKDYTLTAKKLIAHSKECNDIYDKIQYLLKHDKFARFRHRNDKIDTEIKKVVLIDKKDPNKVYKMRYDLLLYNPDFFINEIDTLISVADFNANTIGRKASLENSANSLLNDINNGFMNGHGFIITHAPIIKVTTYKNQKLEDCLQVHKNCLSDRYNIVYIFNQCIQDELQYIQMLQITYNKMLNRYGKDKDNKKFIDTIFKEILKNTSLSMDYNNDSMDLFSETLKHAASELQRFYDIIKS